MAAIALAGNMIEPGGGPAAGCKLTSCIRGTSTPSPLYSDVGLATPTTNPYVGDADGRLEFYYSSLIQYTWTVKTSDSATTLWQADVVGGGLMAANALLPKEKREKPMSPRDPIFYWSSISKRKDSVTQAQAALDEWGEWPSDAEFTGTPGNITKAALETWRYNMRQLQLDKQVLGRELDLDAPISQEEMGMLLAGPGGYKEGKAWKTKRGDAVVVPTP